MKIYVLQFCLVMLFICGFGNAQELYTGSSLINQRIQELLNSLDLGTIIRDREESIILPEGTQEQVFIEDNPIVLTGADKLDENGLKAKVNNNAYSDETLRKIAQFIDPLAEEVKKYGGQNFQRTKVTISKPIFEVKPPVIIKTEIQQPNGQVQALQPGTQNLILNNQPQQQVQTQNYNLDMQQQYNLQQQGQQQQQQEELYKIDNPEQYFTDIINQQNQQYSGAGAQDLYSNQFQNQQVYQDSQQNNNQQLLDAQINYQQVQSQNLQGDQQQAYGNEIYATDGQQQNYGNVQNQFVGQSQNGQDINSVFGQIAQELQNSWVPQN